MKTENRRVPNLPSTSHLWIPNRCVGSDYPRHSNRVSNGFVKDGMFWRDVTYGNRGQKCSEKRLPNQTLQDYSLYPRSPSMSALPFRLGLGPLVVCWPLVPVFRQGGTSGAGCFLRGDVRCHLQSVTNWPCMVANPTEDMERHTINITRPRSLIFHWLLLSASRARTVSLSTLKH